MVEAKRRMRFAVSAEVALITSVPLSLATAERQGPPVCPGVRLRPAYARDADSRFRVAAIADALAQGRSHLAADGFRDGESCSSGTPASSVFELVRVDAAPPRKITPNCRRLT